MTRIALISSSFLPRFGGVERHVLEVARGLRDRGFGVTIWAVDQGDQVPESIDGIRLRYLPCPLPARKWAQIARFLWRLPAAISAWRRAMRMDRPHILNIQCFGPNGVYTTVLSRVTGVSMILSTHGETAGDASDVFGSSALMRRALSAAIKQSSAVTACSRFAANDLLRFVPGTPAVDIVFNGVSPTPPAPDSMPKLPARYIAAVGRLVRNKGFGELLRAFAMLTKVHTEVSLVIGGDGPDRERLQEMMQEFDIVDRVSLVGQLSEAQVAELLGRAEMLVVPSHVEAFGIAVLEGWRARVPIVATRHGGTGEFVQNSINGLLVDPLDSAALCDSMVSLLDEPYRADQIATAGWERVDSFTWEMVTDHYQAVYERALRAKHPQRGVLRSRPPRRYRGD